MMLEHVVEIPDEGHGPEARSAVVDRTVEGLVPEGARAIVGGADHAIEGWGAYEVARRRAEWEHGRIALGGVRVRPGSRYAGRTYIHGLDAAHSVLVGSRAAVGGAGRGASKSALRLAALRLADALGALEDELCEPDEDGVWECASRPSGGPAVLVAPAVTSADLRAFAEDPTQETDPETLYELDGDVATAAAALGSILPQGPEFALRRDFPPLPTQTVLVGDDEAVLRLETDVEPYVVALEQMQAAVATRFEAATDAVRAASRGPRSASGTTGGAARREARKKNHGPTPHPTTATRGEEIDAAAARPPPLAALKGGIPPDCVSAELDIREQPPGFVEASDGLYCGYSNISDPARTTALTPQTACLAAWQTSGRVYAWFILDSAEAIYAVRAKPADGYARKLDEKGLVKWLQARLTGAPPHKLDMDVWLKHLRGLGLEVHVGLRRSSEVRFNLRSSTTTEERSETIDALSQLTEADFLSFDWSDYDATAGVGPCASPTIETAGDVVVDLAAKAVRALKVRPGLPYAAQPHARSYVTFHTHPVGRYHGAEAETPSCADLMFTLHKCARGIMAWHFVSAPEGTYLLRPSALLKKAYLRDPAAVREDVNSVFAEDGRVGATMVIARAVPARLADVGFVAYFRAVPCVAPLGVPDLWPRTNDKSRESLREDYAYAASLSGEEIVGAKWGTINSLYSSPSVQMGISWVSVRCIPTTGPRRMESTGDSHVFSGDLSDRNAWSEFWPGPILVLHFGGPIPRRVPHAAIAAAHANSHRWAWVVFLGADDVLAFRASQSDLEVHGPRMLS